MKQNTAPADRHSAGASHSKRRATIFLLVVALACLLALSRGAGGEEPISITLVGDMMLGRGVAPIAAQDPSGLFEDVRWIMRASDIAAGNLESPLTSSEHQFGPYALEADPVLAEVVSAAGFDVMSLANNHSGDAGAEGLLETVEVLEAAGMRTVGFGIDRSSAAAATRFEVGGTKVAFLAFDASGGGLAASTGPGVAKWDESGARMAVEGAAADSDLLVVSLHGGVEYLPESDPRMLAIGERLTGWGADVVWGHGAHVAQPVLARRTDDGKPNLIATSLGNFIFDQTGPQTGKGMVMQLLADQSGLIAYRLGSTSHADRRVRWQGWELPEADAVLLRGEWWTLVRDVQALPNTRPTLGGFPWGTVVAASEGRLTGDVPEIVVSFRKIPGPHPVRDGLADLQWVDAGGRTAHVGIYTASDLSPTWVAGMIPAPVAGLAVCDGSVALAYSSFDDPATVATGAAVWRQIGLDAAETLSGRGRPGCVDVDSDGVTDPVILDREAEN